jgi:hypothetical protein
MKTPNHLSKNELLAWINSITEPTTGKINRLEDLGNGVAFLLVLNYLKPASVRFDKINKHPISNHDSTNNLNMLAAAFIKLKFNFTVEVTLFPIKVDKLSQRKFQDNYHLACFLYRLHQDQNLYKNSSYSEASLSTPVPHKFKVIAP